MPRPERIIDGTARAPGRGDGRTADIKRSITRAAEEDGHERQRKLGSGGPEFKPRLVVVGAVPVADVDEVDRVWGQAAGPADQLRHRPRRRSRPSRRAAST